jgi:hypothetical protein
MSTITERDLEVKLRSGVQSSSGGVEPEQLEVKDVSGCGCGLKFEILIVSKYDLLLLEGNYECFYDI